MNIALYFTPLWGVTRRPTGVAKHIAHMARHLTSAQNVGTVTLVTSRREYRAHSAAMPSALRSLPVKYVPWGERTGRYAARLLAVERWSGGADWVYCPKEQLIAAGRARLVVTVHDVLSAEPAIDGLRDGLPMQGRARWCATLAKCLRRADVIATVSAFTRERLVELFDVRDERRIVVVGNGVDELFRGARHTADLGIVAKHGVQTGQYLLSVGGFSYRKGGDILLDIAEGLTRRRIDLPILVCGASHDAGVLARVPEGDNAGGPIRRCDYVSDSDLAALYRHSAAFLFPSRYEGFGMPVLEAMAAGAPVVCSDLASLREVAGDAAVLVPGWKPEAWIEALLEVERSRPLRQEMIARGLARSARYTWAQCATRLARAMWHA